ncbi:MAG: Gamma-glutamyltranspeptidase [Gammaproteobacteria bacterium]|nr:Gamma-glutamyltranspeptidase [Gammaproteobacteria bacterium]
MNWVPLSWWVLRFDEKGCKLLNTTRGGIACGHPKVAEAAEEVFQKGGNAFDAIVAAQLSACVVEPVLASLGGGGYLLACPASQRPQIYDFFVQTPINKHQNKVDFYPVDADFGDVTQEFHIGTGSAATPGMVKGVFAIYENLCSLPLAELASPAIRQARHGATVTEMQAYLFDVVSPIYRATESARKSFVGIIGNLPREGELFRRPELADTIEGLVQEGERFFYVGEVARSIGEVCGNGGYLTQDDLDAYEVVLRDPLAFEYRSAGLLTNPPPTFGGLLVAFALHLMEAVQIADLTGGSHLGILTKAMMLTQKARLDALDSGRFDAGNLLNTSYLRRYQQEIKDEFACTRGTTHISTADSKGNIAAMTLSNGEGCGAMVEGSGFMLNNMLGEEDINPGGVGRWQPNRRMASMMAPTVLTMDDKKFSLGSGGSNRIRSAILQVVSNIVDLDMDMVQAVNSPRIHVEGGELNIEKGFPESVLAELEKQVDRIVSWQGSNLFFGGVHAVELSGNGIRASGDARRGGIGLIVR